MGARLKLRATRGLGLLSKKAHSADSETFIKWYYDNKDKSNAFENYQKLEELTMSKKKIKSTYEEFMESKSPEQKKKYQEGYKDLLLSEMILAAMEEDEVSVRKLAKLAGVSPTIIQEMRSGSRDNFNTKSFFKVLRGLGYTILLERNGNITPVDISKSK